jgi:hypothetical protein
MLANLAFFLSWNDLSLSAADDQLWKDWLASLDAPTVPVCSGHDDTTHRYPGHKETR